jgi:hypothetical protein
MVDRKVSTPDGNVINNGCDAVRENISQEMLTLPFTLMYLNLLNMHFPLAGLYYCAGHLSCD